MSQTKLKKSELISYKNFALDLALGAGKILLRYEKDLNLLKINHKKAFGIASNADLESEKYIIKKIQKKYPKHQILGEESSYEEQLVHEELLTGKKLTWVIDPLDGTNNFVNGFNYYAICIALTYNGKPIVGVVYRPSTGEVYYAMKGQGAYYQNLAKKNKPLKLSVKKNSKNFSDILCSTGFSSLRGNSVEEQTKTFLKLVAETRALRRLGSAALDLCLVAHGIFDGFWQTGLSPWDIAAPAIVCEEASVKLANKSGRSYTLLDQFIVAAKEPIFSRLKKFI